MLKAFLHGKARRLLGEGDSQTSHIDYNFIEDTRTTLVFSRLSYLPVPVWWPTFQKVVKPAGLLPDPVGGLDELRFWPSWNLPAGIPRYIHRDTFPDCDGRGHRAP